MSIHLKLKGRLQTVIKKIVQMEFATVILF